MAKLVVAIVLAIYLLEVSAVRTNIEENRRREEGGRLCQKLFGPYYYDDVSDVCCPCSPCDSSNGSIREIDISCAMMGVDHCKVPYITKCKEIGSLTSIKMESPPIMEIRSVTPVTNATDVPSTTEKPPTPTVVKSDPIVKKSNQDSAVAVVLIAVCAALSVCFILVLTCVCCYLRCDRNRASKLARKFPKWPRCSNETTAVNSEQNSVSSDQPFIVSEDPTPGNCIHPSPHHSLTSQHGPPEMNVPLAVHPDSRMSSDNFSEQSSSVHSPPVSFPQSVDYGMRHLVESRVLPQNVNNYPQGNTTTISGCNNAGLIAAPFSHVVIGQLNVHCPVSNPTSSDLNSRQPNRVESLLETSPRTFHEPIQGNGRRTREQEYNFSRQASEISSTSSGPVENDIQSSSRWNRSIPHRDQECALKNCSQYMNEEQTINSETNPSESCSNGVMSYRTMSSGLSLNISQQQSSGLPPRSDVVDENC